MGLTLANGCLADMCLVFAACSIQCGISGVVWSGSQMQLLAAYKISKILIIKKFILKNIDVEQIRRGDNRKAI